MFPFLLCSHSSPTVIASLHSQHPLLPPLLRFFLDDSTNPQLSQCHCDSRLQPRPPTQAIFFEHHCQLTVQLQQIGVNLLCFFLINSTISSSCSAQKPELLLIFPFSIKPFSLASNNCVRLCSLRILHPITFNASTAN